MAVLIIDAEKLLNILGLPMAILGKSVQIPLTIAWVELVVDIFIMMIHRSSALVQGKVAGISVDGASGVDENLSKSRCFRLLRAPAPVQAKGPGSNLYQR
ncbi:unnamed protein product [Heligmosomoides polygyrus]|uniref:MATE efflux family protein n=1 Tax=Heligmosomoides polygyrus TaxID=6339 RepID=A0A183GAH7_HELPZ|nr:unnamed protein product [Heligmosomoides polygyrus]